MKYYGQFDTDKIIHQRYFPDLNYKGNCIEVGAVDGIEISNTYFFENNNWNCLCIEPQPGIGFFESLKSNRKNALNYAISTNENDCVQFTIVYLKFPNTESFIQCSGISGLNIDNKLIERYTNYGCQVKTETINVKTKTLDWCIKQYFNHKTIDFISIDVEGTELDVLKSFDVNAYNTKLLVVENNHSNSEIENYLTERSWKKDFVHEVNEFYIKV